MANQSPHEQTRKILDTMTHRDLVLAVHYLVAYYGIPETVLKHAQATARKVQ